MRTIKAHTCYYQATQHGGRRAFTAKPSYACVEKIEVKEPSEPQADKAVQSFIYGFFTWNGFAHRAECTIPIETLHKLLFQQNADDVLDERGRPMPDNTLIDLTPWTKRDPEPWKPGDEARAIVRPEPVEPEIR